MSKLFVASLSWNVDSEALRTAFSPYGEITDSFVVRDRATGRSRGFGFVTYTDEASAENAINSLNETELDGRTIKVNRATDRAEGGENRGNRDGYNNRREGGGYQQRSSYGGQNRGYGNNSGYQRRESGQRRENYGYSREE